MDAVNRQVRLAARPVGLPKASDWDHTEEPVSEPDEGEVLVKVKYLSLDPAMRGWMNDGRSYVPPVGIGEVMRAGGCGEVLASEHPGFEPGDYVTGITGIQEHAVLDGDAVIKIDPGLAPLPVYLGTLGMPGMTAYFGLLDIGKPKEGETVVVSAAAGAVGSVVGQIAKIKGCRAVGIAGGEEKCRHIVEELGFDAAIDYKSENVLSGLREHCPKGIDVYFDNVGGEILDAALACLARGARIPLCGAISQYNSTEGMRGPANYMSLLVNRGTMTGFLVFDFADRYGRGGPGDGRVDAGGPAEVLRGRGHRRCGAIPRHPPAPVQRGQPRQARARGGSRLTAGRNPPGCGGLAPRGLEILRGPCEDQKSGPQQPGDQNAGDQAIGRARCTGGAGIGWTGCTRRGCGHAPAVARTERDCGPCSQRRTQSAPVASAAGAVGDLLDGRRRQPCLRRAAQRLRVGPERRWRARGLPLR